MSQMVPVLKPREESQTSAWWHYDNISMKYTGESCVWPLADTTTQHSVGKKTVFYPGCLLHPFPAGVEASDEQVPSLHPSGTKPPTVL